MEWDQEFSEYAGARWRTLVGSAVLLGAGPAEAEDLAQTTLMRAYVAWKRVRETTNQDAYVAKILLNTLRETRRRRSWRESPVESVPDESAPDRTSEVDREDAVRRALLALPVSQRSVLVLRFYVRLTVPEIALAVGCPPGTVKSRLSRGLEALGRDPALEGLHDGSTP